MRRCSFEPEVLQCFYEACPFCVGTNYLNCVVDFPSRSREIADCYFGQCAGCDDAELNCVECQADCEGQTPLRCAPVFDEVSCGDAVY